jgi:membrane protein DedA with SNARE-associated domain
MKWFFLLSFIAALICSVLWTALVIFAMASSTVRVGVKSCFVLVLLLGFFIWGAREMDRHFKNVSLHE